MSCPTITVRWLRQQGETTCGHTCVAMLAGVTEDDAIRVIGHQRATRARELVAALDALGVRSSPRIQRIPPRGMPPTAVVNVRQFRPDGRPLRIGHWVVWHAGRYLDPAYGDMSRDDALAFWGTYNVRPTSLLAVTL